MDTLVKAALRSAQAHRTSAAYAMTTFLAPSSWPAIQGALLAGRTYAAAVEEQGRGHQLGPPHPHVACAFLENLGKTLAKEVNLKEADDKEKDDKEIRLVELFTKDSGSPEEVRRCLPVIRVKLTYKARMQEQEKEEKKQEIKDGGKGMEVDEKEEPAPEAVVTFAFKAYEEFCHLQMADFHRALVGCLARRGAVRKDGPAPPDALERALRGALR